MSARPARRRELLESLLAAAVEIVPRYRRAGFALPAQESSDIPPVFAQERIHIIFRMTLEEDEQASPLLDEEVDASIRRAGEHATAMGGELALLELVASRMRDEERRRRTANERIMRDGGAVKDAEAPSRAWRLTPSRCSTAACAARHDQMVEMMLCSAQSMIAVRLFQYGS